MAKRTKPINVRRIQRHTNIIIVLMHFCWHHQTIPSVVLAGLIGNISYEWPTIVSNTLLHTFMYPHFAGIWNAYPILLVLGA
ncbi:unnamed protein product [Rotaria sp. Silwood1]|nr:unnamed protein product [Rotaria sp. Silwood1]